MKKTIIATLLSVLFIAAGGTLNWKQLTAVLAAAIAGMIFNRAGTQRILPGYFFSYSTQYILFKFFYK